MTGLPTRRALGALTLWSALTLAGCASGDAPSTPLAGGPTTLPGATTIPAPTSTPGETTTTVGAPPATTAPEETPPAFTTTIPGNGVVAPVIGSTSPLLDLISAATLASDEVTHNSVEARVAECMRAVGWEYAPVPFHAPDAATVAADTTIVDSLTEAPPVDTVPAPPLDASSDPNLAYRLSLSDDQLYVYNTDLHGSPRQPASTPVGCLPIARAALLGPNPNADPIVSQRIADFHAGEFQDPRLVAVHGVWAACVEADLGPLGLSRSPSFDLRQPLEEYIGQRLGLQRDGDASSENGSFVPSPNVDSALVEDLRRFEARAVATDQRCRAESGLDAAVVAVEQEFIDALLADFPELNG